MTDTQRHTKRQINGGRESEREEEGRERETETERGRQTPRDIDKKGKSGETDIQAGGDTERYMRQRQLSLIHI